MRTTGKQARHILATTFVSFLILSGLTFINFTNVFGAASDDGGSGKPASGPCYGGSGTTWRTCHGGTWIYYPLAGNPYYNSSSDTVNIPNASSVKGGSLQGCAAEGATGYYRLALVSYDKATGNNVTGSDGLYQRALWPASAWKPAGGYITYRMDVPGATAWSTVEASFNAAAAHDATNGLSWPNVSMFCYNPSWGGDTPETPTPDPASGDGNFWSKSSVTAVQGGDVPPGITATTPVDGKAEIRYSTDQDTTYVQFTHTLGYVNTGVPIHSKHGPSGHEKGDTYSDATTKYDITMSGGAGSGGVGTGSYTAAANETKEEQKYNNVIPVTLSPGETKIVCQTIGYQAKNFTFTENSHKENGDDGPPLHLNKWEYTWHSYDDPKGSGQGSSQVCATITRPQDPSGGPSSTGTASSTLMFTGEDATIGWNVSGISYDSRRLQEYQAIAYNHDANVSYSSSRVTGDSRSNSSPCSYYSSRNGINCQIIDNIRGSFSPSGQTHGFSESRTVIVPNNVGWKYCNSFGYRYEYWYYTSASGWVGPYKSYWVNFDAACRTIAKKPSTAVWNSSLMSAGGARTSLAYRYDDARMGLVAGGQNRTLYGSWSEFLDVISGNVTGLTSGSTLAIGSKRHNGTEICRDVMSNNNSPLTIANSDCGNLGHSGVYNNTTFITRLNTYLKNNSSVNHITANQLGTNMTGTNVVHHSGDLNITSNITTAPGPYSSIYQIPQVIIFVDGGNVNISSNVTQIDAWIIAPNGTINTCSDFQNGATEADAIGRASGYCTNQLVFNAPVMAGGLRLYRSFGSDPNIGYRFGTFGAPSSKQASGEVFNLRADTYLWAYAQAGRYDSSYTESYTRELAPRY